MLSFAVGRLARFAFVLFATSLVAFVLLRFAGDPASVLLPVQASPADRAALREAYGLNDNVLVQYFAYAWQALQGNFGISWGYRRPAIEVVLERLPATLELVFGGLIVALVVAVPLALLSARRAGGRTDSVILSSGLVARAIPNFWFGTVLILVFSVHLGWFPTSGAGTAGHLVLPIATIAFFFVAEFTMVLRASLIDALHSDHVLAATARGATGRGVLLRHGLRNSLNPLVSVIGVNFGALLGGTVIVEAVFGWPGLGRLAVEAVTRTDFPVLQAAVLVFAAVIAVGNMVTDLLYGVLDPRIRRAT
ncbi:ABC transporter permease [Plantactinospora sp. GCM10030261]|uniref:ABC transporter permease n=1 Tax=Plantactinospora sp. GCM10030261 TaxID=3273420 RepID=UPI003612142A